MVNEQTCFFFLNTTNNPYSTTKNLTFRKSEYSRTILVSKPTSSCMTNYEQYPWLITIMLQYIFINCVFFLFPYNSVCQNSAAKHFVWSKWSYPYQLSDARYVTRDVTTPSNYYEQTPKIYITSEINALYLICNEVMFHSFKENLQMFIRTPWRTSCDRKHTYIKKTQK